MQKHKLTFNIIALIVLTDFLESTYEFFFKKGMLSVGEFDFSNFGTFGDFALRTLSNGWIWIGLIIILIETLTWFIVLSKIDLSLAFPVSSLSYIFVILASAFMLHEHVGANRWIGTLIIIAGISLVVKSSEQRGGG